LHARLKEHAAAHGHSMEEEVCSILRELAATARRTGRIVGVADLQIAATARPNKAVAVATRNIGHFADCGLQVVDPWSAGAIR